MLLVASKTTPSSASVTDLFEAVGARVPALPKTLRHREQLSIAITTRLEDGPSTSKEPGGYGAMRSICHDPSRKTYRSRSCNRLGRPCQNSNITGDTR